MHFDYIGVVENSQGERQSRLINKQLHGWTDIAGCRYNKDGSPLDSDVTLVFVNTINGEKVFSQELTEPKGKGFHWLRNIEEDFVVESYGNGFYSLTGNSKTYRWKELVEQIKVTQYLGRAFPPNEGR